MTEPKLSLHKKLAQVMYEADRIPKNGTAPAAMGSFKFVQVGDAADVIRKALAEKGVSMIPSAIELVESAEHTTAGGKAMTTMTVRTTWTLTDGESGETAVIQSLGSGADTGDKAAPKAQSNAMKYALLMGFLLSTGDDPEMHDTSDRRGRAPAAPPASTARPPAAVSPDGGGLVGTAVAQGTQDFNLRESPDGWSLPFRLKAGSQTQIVIARDELALALDAARDKAIGKLVTVWGPITTEAFTKADKKITFNVLTAVRIKGDGFDIAAAEPDIDLDVVMADVPAA